jgi:hypothetical protein
MPTDKRVDPTAPSLARGGHGPLLQRDYWAVIHRCQLTPAEVIELVRTHFAEFAPPELCRFGLVSARGLALGDELSVVIRGAGRFAVRVIHQDAQSLTFATLGGHPEAGRITFGAYRNRHGAVLFHIRSRARSRSPLSHLGFRTLGEAMQTNTWTEFVQRVANTAGEGVQGELHALTTEVPDEPEDFDGSSPTYAARGG